MSKNPENSERSISYDFQERLLQLLDEYDLNKYQFADSIHIAKETMSRATLYAVVPSVRTLIKIANYFEISLENLLGEVARDDFYLSDHPTSFQIRLKELSEEKGLTYSKIAHEMPFSRNLFFDWIRKGTLPSLDYLLVLAQYFDVSPDYLLGRTDERHN